MKKVKYTQLMRAVACGSRNKLRADARSQENDDIYGAAPTKGSR